MKQVLLVLVILALLCWLFYKPITKIIWSFIHRKHLKQDIYVDKCFKCKTLKKQKQKELKELRENQELQELKKLRDLKGGD